MRRERVALDEVARLLDEMKDAEGLYTLEEAKKVLEG